MGSEKTKTTTTIFGDSPIETDQDGFGGGGGGGRKNDTPIWPLPQSWTVLLASTPYYFVRQTFLVVENPYILVCFLGRPVAFLGAGFPSKIDVQKKKSWYPYSNLSNLEDLVFKGRPTRTPTFSGSGGAGGFSGAAAFGAAGGGPGRGAVRAARHAATPGAAAAAHGSDARGATGAKGLV